VRRELFNLADTKARRDCAALATTPIKAAAPTHAAFAFKPGKPSFSRCA